MFLLIEKLAKISMYTSYSGDILLFIFSLAFCYKSYNPAYLRIFPIYCFAGLAADLIGGLITHGSLLSVEEISKNGIMINLFNLIDLPFLSYFIGRHIESKNVKRVMIILNILYICYYIYLFSRYGFIHNLAWPMIIEPFILMIVYFTYFREILQKPRVADLSRDPMFWMTTGFLFYSATFIPVIFFDGYFLYHGMEDLAQGVYSINSFSGIITDLLCIKGMTCRKPR